MLAGKGRDKKREREEKKRRGLLVLWADVRLLDGCLGVHRCTEALWNEE